MGFLSGLIPRKFYRRYYEKEVALYENITNMVKILGFVATAIGFGAELLHDWVDEKEMDAKIEEKVNEALAKREENEDEEES